MKNTTLQIPSLSSYARLALAFFVGLLAVILVSGGPSWDLEAVAADRIDIPDPPPFETSLEPLGLHAIPSGWSNTREFTLEWENPTGDTPRTVVITGAYYSVDVAPTSVQSGTLVEGEGITRLVDISLPNQAGSERPFDGEHDVWVWLVEQTGEFTYTEAASTTYLYDATPPTVVITAPEYVDVPSGVTAATFDVAWKGTDASPLSYTVDFRDAAWMTWTNWISQETILSATFKNAMVGHSYVFSVTAEDRVGLTAVDTTTVQIRESTESVTTTVFLPLVMKFSPALANGGFESGDLSPGWSHIKDGVSVADPNAGGDGLAATVETSVVTESATMTETVYGGRYAALLGSPKGQNGDLPVGYGSIVQEIHLPEGASQLEFAYRVVTNDLVRGADDLYYDTFEVSINEAPDLIDDAARVAKCAKTSLNPTGVISATEGLVLCGGRHGSPSDLGTLWDSGWLRVTLDTSALTGTVKLYLTVWGREHDEAYYNDEGWYNTWAYVDDVVLKE